ncbi:MAG: Mth938-like domain-containing protein [Betaproteobacteria bacterium]
MKFHLSAGEGNVITGAGPGWVRIGTREYRENLVITAETIATGWAAGGFDALAEADFEGLASLAPDLVVLGTGPALRFPHPRLTRALVDARIGLETMDTAAACRTFNVLAAEGRRVAAALLLR